MARKLVLQSYDLFDFDSDNNPITQPITASFVSKEMDITNLDYGSLLIKWTGDLTGDFFIEVKNGTESDWYALDLGASVVVPPIDASSFYHIILREFDFTNLRVRFQRSGGTSSVMSCVLTAKTVGA